MIGTFQVRTDLALEARESYEEDDARIRGVKIQETEDPEKEIYTTVVIIETENGARAMGKPVGTYITLEAPNLSVPDEGCHREISREIARHVGDLLGEGTGGVLVVGLGNREVTPDALGPEVVNHLRITRHMIREFGRVSVLQEGEKSVSAIVPGVMAQTGMETLEIVKGIVKQTEPDAVVVIDALAARSTRRLNRTIQITDAGIHPGSGVGNHREGISREILGIPVIAIGVPTVVDAATIVNDTMETLVEALDRSDEMKKLGGMLGNLDRAEKYQLIQELISPHLNTMFVTPKDIDDTIRRLSFTISEGLNLAFSSGEKQE